MMSVYGHAFSLSYLLDLMSIADLNLVWMRGLVTLQTIFFEFHCTGHPQCLSLICPFQLLVPS